MKEKEKNKIKLRVQNFGEAGIKIMKCIGKIMEIFFQQNALQ